MKQDSIKQYYPWIFIYLILICAPSQFDECGCLAVDPSRSALKVTGKVRSGPRPSRSRPEVRSRVKPGKERDEEGEMCDVVSCCISWDLISVLNIGQKVNISRSC